MTFGKRPWPPERISEKYKRKNEIVIHNGAFSLRLSRSLIRLFRISRYRVKSPSIRLNAQFGFWYCAGPTCNSLYHFEVDDQIKDRKRRKD